MSSVTLAIADYLSRITYDDIPKDVTDRIKLHIIDNLSNIVGGTSTHPAQITDKVFLKYGGAKESTFLHTGKKGPSPFVVNVNAYLSNVLDYDDTYENFAHPGATAIPSALAMAERERSNGKELLTAIVLGYEISLRIGRAIIPSPERSSKVWGFATWQTFGGVVSAAKLLALDKKQILDALGIAGMSAPVPSIRKLGMNIKERPFTWLKNNYGWSAMAGVISSELAQEGLIGNRGILDGENGFWVMAGSDQFNPEEITDQLGEKYLSIDTSFKPYPSCRWTHAAIDAVKIIVKNNKVEPEKIKAIAVSSFEEAQRSLSNTAPKNIVDAQFSLPYLLALELHDKPSVKGLDEGDLNNQKLLDTARQVEIKVDSVLDREFIERRKIKSQVDIHFTNGEKISQFVDVPKGEPENPITNQEIEEKFFNLADIFPKPVQLEILNDIYNLENIVDIQDMINRWYKNLRD